MLQDQKIDLTKAPYKRVKVMDMADLATALTLDVDEDGGYSIRDKFKSLLPMILTCQGEPMAVVTDIQTFDQIVHIRGNVQASEALDALLMKRGLSKGLLPEDPPSPDASDPVVKEEPTVDDKDGGLEG